jgi:hypothetical protein
LDLEDDQVLSALKAMWALLAGMLELWSDRQERVRKALRMSKREFDRIVDEGENDTIICCALFREKMEEYDVDLKNKKVAAATNAMLEVISAEMESQTDTLEKRAHAVKSFAQRRHKKSP